MSSHRSRCRSKCSGPASIDITTPPVTSPIANSTPSPFAGWSDARECGTFRSAISGTIVERCTVWPPGRKRRRAAGGGRWCGGSGLNFWIGSGCRADRRRSPRRRRRTPPPARAARPGCSTAARSTDSEKSSAWPVQGPVVEVDRLRRASAARPRSSRRASTRGWPSTRSTARCAATARRVAQHRGETRALHRQRGLAVRLRERRGAGEVEHRRHHVGHVRELRAHRAARRSMRRGHDTIRPTRRPPPPV